MSQRVLREGVQILGEDVVAAADECQRACRLDETDRAAWARPERDELVQIRKPVRHRIARRGRERDRVADECGVDIDVENRALQRLQILE